MNAAESATLPPAVDDATREEARFLWPPIILCILAVWIVPMGSSLGLDESGNWWVIKDGFTAMIERAGLWSGGQSVPFNLIVMAARSLFGGSEFVLRLPAVLMMLGTLALIYRLGLRLGGPLAAGFSCLAFVTMREVMQVASTVRPFALGVLLATGAMLALIRWLDHGRLRDALAYVALAALTPYANYLHGFMFLVHAIYASIRIYRKDTSVKPAAVLVSWLACGILMVPLLSQALALYGRRGQEIYLNAPNAEAALASVAPPLFLGAVMLALCLHAVVVGRAPLRAAAVDAELFWFAAVWAVVPPLALIGLSAFTEIQVFAGRYYVVNAPGVALLAGMLLRKLEPPRSGRFLAVTVACCAILYYGFQEGFLRGLFDHRGAAAGVAKLAQPNTPVIVVSGYTESNYLPNVADPVLSQALLAPVLRYRMPGQLIPVPGTLTGEAESYLERLFTEKLQYEPRFVLTGLLGAEFYRAWLAGRGAAVGFHMRSRTEYSGVLVMLFEKDGATQ